MKHPTFMEGYEDFAAPRQMDYINAIREHGSGRAAAQVLGISHQTLNGGLRRLRLRASKQGFAPEHDQTRPAPVGQRTRGTSTLYGPEGEVKLQWVKTALDNDEIEELLLHLQDELKDRIPPMGPLPDLPEDTTGTCATIYPMGDPHIGMYAWGEETGEDFDTDIAHRDLLVVFDRLLASAPPTRQAVILNLGDFFHADSQAGVTARSGHRLDTDTRWARVLQVGIRIMVDMVSRALRRHNMVTVRNCIGNHDDHTSIVLAYALDAYYRNEPRVVIEKSPSMFWYWRFGDNLIGATHGDKTKLPDLPLIMAHDRPEDWGACRNRYWYTGHVHSRNVVEQGGVVCESFRTLAARDAWHAGQRYRSGRDMHAIVLHKKYGETDRIRVDLRWARDDMEESE